MTARHALILAGLTMLVGCGPNPNTPEPPPPPPVVPGPVAPGPMLPADPVKPALVNPTSLPGDTSAAPTTSPVEPAPAPTPAVSTAELLKQLEQAQTREAAALALAAQGKEATPVLTKALEHADWQVRAAAVFALGKIGKDAAAAKDKLKALAEKDENEDVRVAAAFALDALAE